MPFPPGPAKAPWRRLVSRFLEGMYGGGVRAPEAAFLPEAGWAPRRLEDVLPFAAGQVPAPFTGGGRAFLARQLLEAQAAGRAIPDRPVARVVAVERTPGGRLQFTLAQGRRHDDLASGQAMAAELMSAFWDEAGGLDGPPEAPDDVEALFSRVARRVMVRNALAPDRAGLRDLSRRVVRLRVEAAVQGPGGLLLEWRPATAEEYPRLWGLPVGGAVELDDATAGAPVSRWMAGAGAGEAPPDPEAPVALGWDLLDGNLVLLIRAPAQGALPAPGGRTLREVAGGGEDEFLRRSPVVPSAAAVLGGLL